MGAREIRRRLDWDKGTRGWAHTIRAYGMMIEARYYCPHCVAVGQTLTAFEPERSEVEKKGGRRHPRLILIHV